jgi:membrane protein implicated in regulation of membrane protease activity
MSRRRWLGVIFVAAALALLIGGETMFKSRLQGVTFVVYWLACLLFTTLAIVVALLEIRALREQTREEHRTLIEDTLREIEREARARPRRPGGSPPRNE